MEDEMGPVSDTLSRGMGREEKEEEGEEPYKVDQPGSTGGGGQIFVSFFFLLCLSKKTTMIRKLDITTGLGPNQGML